MKLQNLLGVVCLGLGLAATSARADLMAATWSMPVAPNSQPESEAAMLDAIFGDINESPLYLGKKDGGSWSNDSLLDETYFPTIDVDGGTATVEWDLTGSGYILQFIVVKSAQDWHVYRVTEHQWVAGGPHDINTGVPAGNNEEGPPWKDVSHISFYGWQSNGVPDGGLTAVLLGLGLAGLAAARRIRKS